MTIRAIYENGVFRPTEPVVLPEQTRVTVDVAVGATNESPVLTDEEWSLHLVDWVAEDTIEETDVKSLLGGGKQVVMIRRRACSELNDEDSKYCQECGKPI